MSSAPSLVLSSAQVASGEPRDGFECNFFHIERLDLTWMRHFGNEEGIVAQTLKNELEKLRWVAIA